MSDKNRKQHLDDIERTLGGPRGALVAQAIDDLVTHRLDELMNAYEPPDFFDDEGEPEAPAEAGTETATEPTGDARSAAELGGAS